MLKPNTVRRRVLLRLLGSPVVLAPFVAGMTALTAMWATGSRLTLGLFAGLAGLLTAAGTFLTRLILDDGATARAVLRELDEEDRRARQSALDNLDRQLVQADKDPRPETALRDLRALVNAFDEVAAQPDSVNLHAIIEVRSKVQELFEQSVRSIELTLKLGATANRLQTPAAREPILVQREKIIADVEAGIRQLGGTLAALQGLGAGSGNGPDLARLRDELDQSLQVARRVEERLETLLASTPPVIAEQQ
jgi:hypothetical protein